MQRREWICRHLWPRGRDFSQECRFACIGVANQPCVGDRPQLEQEMSLLTFLPLGVLPRGAIPRALEMTAPFAPCSAAAKANFLRITAALSTSSNSASLCIGC